MLYHFLILPTIIFAVISYNFAFENGKPTCDHYILNTYLYSVTYLFLMTYFVTLIMYQFPKLLEKVNMLHVIGVTIVNLITFAAIVFMSSKQYGLKHLLSLIYIATSSFLLSWIFAFFDSKAVLSAVIMSIVLFVILTIIAFKFQDIISSKLPLTFVMIFILMVIAQFIIGILYPSSLLEKIIIVIVLMLICFLVLVKTKGMIENKEECKSPYYVKESIGFIMSFKNILIQLLQLKSEKRR
jgi:FtsH-binding integral membrane protein